MAKKLSEDEIKWILSVESTKAQQEIHKLTKANKELNTENNRRKKLLTELEAAGKKESEEYKRLRAEIKQTNSDISRNDALIAGLTKRMDLSQLTTRQLAKRAKELSEQLKDTSKATDPKAYKQLSSELKAVKSRMSELSSSGKNVLSFLSASALKAGALAGSIALAGAAVKSTVSSNIDINKEFEQSVANLAAILDITPDKMKMLIGDAKHLGSTTEYTSAQVVSLQEELAKLGFSQNEIHNSTEPILLLASALGADLPRASALAGAALRAFQLPATETARVASVMTAGANASALSFEYIETSMSTVAPVARAFGFTIEDTIALLGALSDSGFDASSAATATRNILLNMADSSGKLAKALGQPVTKLDDLVSGLINLRERGVDLNTTLELTDKRSVSAFNTFLAGAEHVGKLSEKVTDADGVLRRMAETKLDTAIGDTKILSSTWEGLMLRFTAAKDIYRGVVQGITKGLAKISDAFTPASEKMQQQLSAVSELESTIPSLVDRYEELSSRSSLSADDQAELRDVITQIGTAIPGVITQFDEYGNALQLNTQRVWDYLAAERARLRYLNKEAIEDAEKDIKRAKTYIKILQDAYKSGDSVVELPFGGISVGMTKATDDELTEIYQKILAQQDIIAGAQEQLKKLRGDDIEQQAEYQARQITLRKQFNQMDASELSEWIRLHQNASDAVLKQYAGYDVQSKDTLERMRSEYSLFAAMAQEIYSNRFPEEQIKISIDFDSESSSTALKNLEAAHQEEINVIRADGQARQQTEALINDRILRSDIEYYSERARLLESYLASEKKSGNQAEYRKGIVEARAKIIAAEVSLEKNAVSEIEKWRADALAREQAVTGAATTALQKALSEKRITQQDYEFAVLNLSAESSRRRLDIENTYLSTVNDLELKNGTLKADAVAKANQAVLTADLTAAKARAEQQSRLDTLLADFKGKFKITTPQEDLDLQLASLDATYQASRDYAQANNMSTLELDQAYALAKEKLIADSESRILAIRKQYGLVSQQELYEQQQLQLAQHLSQGLLTNEDYEKAVINLKRDYYKQQFDYYRKIVSDAVSSLQQAEIQQIEDKYAVEIEAAKGNEEEVARLENEKAQKKLDVEKKYADINFAIKLAQITSDTAASIMATYRTLGWPAGIPAAALMGATGIAQAAVAMSEWQKIKNMTLSGSSASGSSGARVLSGREGGGSIDVIRSQDGRRFRAAYDPSARGYVDRPTVIVGEGPAGHSREWIASNAAVSNPTVAPIISLIDERQRIGDIATVDMNRLIRTRLAGFESGGLLGNVPKPSSSSLPASHGRYPSEYISPSRIEKVLGGIESELAYIREYGIYSSVVLSDFERKQNLRDRSRKIGSKNPVK